DSILFHSCSKCQAIATSVSFILTHYHTFDYPTVSSTTLEYLHPLAATYSEYSTNNSLTPDLSHPLLFPRSLSLNAIRQIVGHSRLSINLRRIFLRLNT